MKIVEMKITAEIKTDDGDSKSKTWKFKSMNEFTEWLNQNSNQMGDSIKGIAENLDNKAKLLSIE